MTNFQKIISIFSFVFVLLFVVNNASASTISHTCNDGGIVNAIVDIDPKGPFLMFYQSNFNATGFITSTCGSRYMNLTAQNNGGGVVALISETWVSPTNQFPIPQAFTTFQSPAGAPNIFNVHFVIGVYEPDINILMGSAGPEFSTSAIACSNPWAAFIRAYHTDYGDYPITGQRIYNNAESNGMWIITSFNNGPLKAIQTNLAGIVTDIVNCN